MRKTAFVVTEIFAASGREERRARVREKLEGCLRAQLERR